MAEPLRSQALPAPKMAEDFVQRDAVVTEGWRALPTAWIHLVFVECVHLWMAVGSWMALVNAINYKCALLQSNIDTHPIEEYYADLFFFGHAANLSIDFNGGKPLVLSEQLITDNGLNPPWMVVAWLLPFGAGILFLYILFRFAQTGIWSFEEAAYLNFTWMLPRDSMYGKFVAFMAVGPIILPFLWAGQWYLYVKGDEAINQMVVFQSCTLPGIVLVFSLNLLAFPTVPLHNWQSSPEFLALQFRRSPLSFLLGRNNNFGLKLLDALWTAQHGDPTRLRRYLHDPSQFERVLVICRRAQEREASSRRAPRDASDSEENSQSDEVVLGRPR